MITSLVTAAVLCCAALTCPTEKAACDSTAQVQNVALESKASSDCPLACGGEKAVVQNVAMTTESKDCATPCKGESVAVQNVALKAESKDCSTPCKGEQVAVQNVAMTTEAKDCSAPCSEAKVAACTDSKSGMATPAMAFQVGDTTVHCPVSAKAMASEQKSEMKFVVDGVTYQTEAEAKVAHMISMERFTESLTRVALVVNGETVECAEKAAACKTACASTTVQYQVGAVKFDNAEAAVRAAAAAHAAMQSVKMSYAVNGEATNCSVDAKAKSTSCGSPVEFVVNGTKTDCDKTAKYLLTRERMAAAVAAFEKTIG